MKSKNRDYQHLQQISRNISVLKGVQSLLEWDHETYMPQEAFGIRTEQIKTMAGLIHKEKTGKKFRNALEKLINLESGGVVGETLIPPQKAALREWRRDYLKETVLPKSFVENFAQLSSEAMQVWHSAKEENDFKKLKPYLEKIVALCRKKADLVGYKKHPYDALLDDYEPHITTQEISELFADLRKNLVSLIKKIGRAKQVDDRFLHGKFSPQKQLAFGKELLKAMGYDMKKGRLDLSAHPFSSAAHPTDSRVTTHIHPSSLMSNIFSVIHEGGHSLYDMALPEEEYGSPLGEPISMGVHESQSRFWETRIGRSKAFWKYFLPRLKKNFKLDKISLDKFYRAINKTEPSLIRIEADEVTYNLHVVLRFEIECALIEGSMRVDEIPEVWNEKMKELLGVTPKNDKEGCLQDIHWSIGAFGYFPSYTLGNLYAAQIFLGFERDHPEWETQVAQGDLIFIKEWLNRNVHQHGRRYSIKELLKKINGNPLSTGPFVEYLRDKYSEIYKIILTRIF